MTVDPFVLVLAFACGAASGSFAAVVVERIPAGLSINGRSSCVCGTPIPGWWNVPVVSWLLLRGRARCCGARIPAGYLAAEAALGTAWTAATALTAAHGPLAVAVSCVAVTVVGTAVALHRRRATVS